MSAEKKQQTGDFRQDSDFLMGYFSKDENALCYRYDAERVRIEAWGTNSLRVRATKEPQMPEENWALSEPVEKTAPVIAIDKYSAQITNGKITAKVNNIGKISFYNDKDELILSEYLRNRRDMFSDTTSSLEVEAREFKPIIGGDYCLTMRFVGNRKEKIFGSDVGLVQDKRVFITGLSASEKEKLSFRESDFVKAVSTFLSSKRIDAKTVEFLQKMDISAVGAQEYLAVLPGHDDFYLVVLMYPEYPGKYILSFLDLDGLAGSLEEKEKQKKDSAPETSAVNTPVQALQTQQVSTSPPVQAPVQTQPQNTAQTEEKYDATNLTIMTVPSTLSNYLDNKYELQYTLYEYLFRNGKRGVSTAAVDDFDIDPDDRIAEITFELDDGSTVYGSYDKDSNSYSYSS